MKGYIDVHCHVLPGMDDGAKSMEEMLQMAEIAYHEGIRSMIATPHYHPKRGEADAEMVGRGLEHARNIIQQKFPDMEIYKGNEIYYRQDMTGMLKDNRLLTLAGSDYVMVEFSTDVSKRQVKQTAGQLQMAGYMPVIAHVERYEELVGEYAFIEELVNAGVYIQVNVSSVTGDMGGTKKRFIKKLIKKEWVHFIGTDAHDTKYRPPLMKKCAAYLCKKFDEDTMELLLYYNPAMIIKNKVI